MAAPGWLAALEPRAPDVVAVWRATSMTKTVAPPKVTSTG